MILSNFIQVKTKELMESGLYRNVKFKSATDIGLRRNGTTQNFLTTNSNINKTGEEVKDFTFYIHNSDVNSDLLRLDKSRGYFCKIVLV